MSGARPSEDTARAGGESGFTLIELVVALTLFALIGGLLAGGLNLISRTWERGEAMAAANESVVLAQRLLRRDLSRLVRVAIGEPGEPLLAFRGTPRQLDYVVVEPPYPTATGLYFASLTIEETDAGWALLRRRALYARAVEDFDDIEFPPAEESLVAVLPVAVGFAYFEPGEEAEAAAGRWRDDWDDPDSPPALIRLAAEEAGEAEAWPPLVVQPRLAFEPDCALGAPEALCSRVAIPPPPPPPQATPEPAVPQPAVPPPGDGG